MGLFSKKNHDEPTSHHTPGDSALRHGDTTTRDNYGTQAGVTGVGSDQYDSYDRDGSNTGITGTGDLRDREGHGHGLGTGHTHGGQRGTGMETYGDAPGVAPGHDNYAQGGTAAGAAHSGSGGGKAFQGKVEKGLGTMLGSESLKAKGLEKEREAEILREQASHIEHAERLELEAKMHRNAATNAHAASHNANVPAGNNSTVPGDQLMNAPGGGHNGLMPGGGAIGRSL